MTEMSDTKFAPSELRVVATRGVDHLALVTDDMPATMDFYTRVLAMQLVHVRRVPFAPNRGQPPYEDLRHYFFNMGGDQLLAFFEYPKDVAWTDRYHLGGRQHLAQIIGVPAEGRSGRLDAVPGALAALLVDHDTVGHDPLTQSGAPQCTLTPYPRADRFFS